MKLRKLLLVGLFFCPLKAKKSDLTLVIVIDQFAYHQLQRLKKHLTGGIGYLLKNGIVYEECYMPHGYPQTAVGHTSISTGALPKDHGIIANIWQEKHNKLVFADADDHKKAGILNSKTHKYGRSAHHLLVDTLSDQLVLRSSPEARCEAVALSLESLPAISLAGHAGTPFWFDSHTGQFTSSKAYMASLPSWVNKFNTDQNLPALTTIKWNLAYPSKSPAYQFNNIHNYEFTGKWGIKSPPTAIAGTVIKIDQDAKAPYKAVMRTPKGVQLITNFAKSCIDTYVDYKKPDRLLLWVSYSTIDTAGHPFGPDSMEAIDLLYHIDRNIQQLLDHASKRFGPQNVTFALVSDHGVMPIPEIARSQGYAPAQRILAADLIKSINDHIKKKLNIDNAVSYCIANQLYLQHSSFDALPADKQTKLLQEIKKFVLTIPGILRAWTFNELKHSNYDLNQGDIEAYFRNQLMQGRSGDIILQVRPYILITDAEYGTSHTSPYDYDTHIPLVLCKRNALAAKRITQKVFAQQLAPSLAYLMEIPRPSASTFKLLPGIEKE